MPPRRRRREAEVEPRKKIFMIETTTLIAHTQIKSSLKVKFEDQNS